MLAAVLQGGDSLSSSMLTLEYSAKRYIFSSDDDDMSVSSHLSSTPETPSPKKSTRAARASKKGETMLFLADEKMTSV